VSERCKLFEFSFASREEQSRNRFLIKLNKHIINSEFSRFQSVTVKGHFSYHLALLSLPSYTPLEVCKAHKGKISQHLL